jgi:TetR/AcrR family acrAB operon transcriptional repressor/TetR/AcrR family transcriptional repressor of mexAB-oprM operon
MSAATSDPTLDPSPDRSPSARAARTRERLLDAAGQCFASQGFSRATVEEIAHSAGVSKGLVYHHFRSKDEILLAVLDRTLEQWEAVGTPPDPSQGAAEALATLQRNTIGWARQNPLVRAIIRLDPMVRQAVGSDWVEHVIAGFQGRIVECIEAGVATGELRRDLDIARTADVVRMLVFSMLEHMHSPGAIDSVDDDFVEASLDVILRGISNPSH